MLKGCIVRQQRFILRPGFVYHMIRIFRKHIIQSGLLLLDLLYKDDHCIVIRGDDMAERHFMYVHGGLADLCQPALAVHIIIGNIGGACIHVPYIKNRRNH